MAEQDLNVCEGIAGMWHYHLRRGTSVVALCGARVMHTSIPLARWGKTPPGYHIPESWCLGCTKLRGDG